MNLDGAGKPMLLEDMIAGITDEDEPAPAAGGNPEPAAEEAPAEAPAADEPEEPAAEEPGAEDEPEAEERKRPSWQAKRFGKLTADLAAERNAKSDLQAKLDAIEAASAGEEGGGKLYTQAEVDALVATQAEQRASAKVTGDKLDALFDKGVSAHKDFEARVTAYGQAFGPDLAKRTDFFDALTELPNGADVIYELGGDLDHMAEVLEMTPYKMGIELERMSSKLTEAAKPKPKPITKAPTPITPLETKARTELAMDDDDMPMEEFEKRFNKMMAAKD